MLLKKLKSFFLKKEIKEVKEVKEAEKSNVKETKKENQQLGDTMSQKQETKLEVEATPNPNALKFIFPSTVIKEGKITFTSKQEVPHVPLLSALLDVSAVVQIHLFENVITVSKDDNLDWQEVEPEIKEVINSLIDSHHPDFEIASADKPASYEDLPPELREINVILDRTIRPGLQGDGGDLEVLELRENNELVIRYEGACGSCPSSTSGTMYAIEGILKDEFHPDIKVVTG